MGRFLTELLGRLGRRLLASRHSQVLTLLGALILAGLGTINLLQSRATALPAGQPTDKAVYSLAGKVVHVADGDTFTLLVDGRQQRIRLASIDAPETTHDRRRPGQPMAQASKQSLADLVAGKTLRLACFEHDRYERSVCDVPLGDGSTANQKQVATGMAWANMQGHGKYMRDTKLPELEAQARRAKLGLWQDPNPVQPWVWRYRCWKEAQC
ncbi:MAG: thermonuclease family protein [Paralcaligenes sp.]